eukprot:TRINITY_DN4211_c0_g2_i3.p1 TRINITY_DN4211_c0_g2~~TRINITY_DN4211_c0_g2_i3.p1  ORF type:complete len:130 (-),score=56.23 TRINITY_DN4211_c0_g2_i3:64-453(-)
MCIRDRVSTQSTGTFVTRGHPFLLPEGQRERKKTTGGERTRKRRSKKEEKRGRQREGKKGRQREGRRGRQKEGKRGGREGKKEWHCMSPFGFGLFSSPFYFSLSNFFSFIVFLKNDKSAKKNSTPSLSS